MTTIFGMVKPKIQTNKQINQSDWYAVFQTKIGKTTQKQVKY